MRTHRVLLATAATGLLFVPAERAALSLLHGAPVPLHAEAQAGKEGGRGGSGDRDRDRGDRGGKKGDHDRDGDSARKGGHEAAKGHGGRTGRGAKAHKGGRADPDNIRQADFVRRIDNPYFSLKPGTTFVYKGPETVGRVTVTRRTKEILGVRTVVVKDIERIDGEIAEKTFDWYAQDKQGNVWYFGEKTAEYENGVPVTTAGSWKAGVAGAKPGIVMQAKPRVGQTYRQEFAPGVAEDAARVVSLNARANVPFGRFRGVLKTFDFTPLEPDVKENKYYAPGVGQVLAVDLETGEREELVRIERGK